MAVEQGYTAQVPVRAATPRPQASPADYGAGLGAAVGELGDTLHRGQVTQYQIQRAATRDQELTQFAKGFALYRQNMAGVSREARTGGELDGHEQRMSEAVEAGRDALLGNVTDDGVRRMAEGQFDEYAAQFNTGEADWAALQRAKGAADDFGQARDTAANGLQAPGTTFQQLSDELGRADEQVDGLAGLEPDQKDKLKRETGQSYAIAYVQGLNDRDPKLALGKLDAGVFDELVTPEQKQALRNGSEVELRRIDAEARSRAAAQRSAVNDQVSVAIKRVEAGENVPDGDLSSLEQQAGAAQLPESRLYDLRDARVKNQVNHTYRAASTTVIAADLGQLDTQIADAGGKAPPEWTMQRNQLAQVLIQRRAAIASDQTGWAAQNGIDPGQIDWTAPTPQALQQRAIAVETAAGQAGVQPQYFTRDETLQRQQAMNAGRSGFVSALHDAQAFGPGRATVAARQLAPKDLGFQWLAGLDSHAASLAWDGREAAKGNAAILTLNSEQKLDFKDRYDAQDKALGEAIATLDPSMQSGVRQTARQIEAGLLAGGATGSRAGVRMAAINLALGGNGNPVNGQTGGLGSWGGHAFVLPPSMTVAQFTGALRASAAHDGPVEPDGKTPANLARAHPVWIGPGRYSVVDASGNPLRRKDGSAFVAEIH